MFNFIIVLSAAPFFVLAEDDSQVEEICNLYKDKVFKVIKGQNLEPLTFKISFSLSKEETLLIPEIVEENQLELISEEEKELISEEISSDLNN